MANHQVSAVDYVAGVVIHNLMLPVVIVLVLGILGFGMLVLRKRQSEGRKR